jgi:hypothetical protein
MKIRVNNVEISESDFEEYGIASHKQPNGKTAYVLYCDKCGIEVEFNGQDIKVGLANKYVNKQHGVCGHYNLDSADELMTIAVGGEKKAASGLRGFHAHYTENKAQGECDPESVIERIQAGNKKSGNNNQEDDDSYKFVGSPSSSFGGRRQSQKWQNQPEDSSDEVTRQIGVMEVAKKNAEKQKREEANGKRKAMEQQMQGRKKAEVRGAKSWEDDFLQPTVNSQQPTPWEMDDEEQMNQGQEVSDDFGQSGEQNGSGEAMGRRKTFGPRLMTKVLEKRDAVCFSRQPIRECPEGSRARYQFNDQSAETLKKQVEFLCMPRRSLEARRLMNDKRQSPSGRIAVIVPIGSQDEEPQLQIKMIEIMLPKDCLAF